MVDALQATAIGGWILAIGEFGLSGVDDDMVIKSNGAHELVDGADSRRDKFRR